MACQLVGIIAFDQFPAGTVTRIFFPQSPQGLLAPAAAGFTTDQAALDDIEVFVTLGNIHPQSRQPLIGDGQHLRYHLGDRHFHQLALSGLWPQDSGR